MQVRLAGGLHGSSVLISSRNSYNLPASLKCLRAACPERDTTPSLGVVMDICGGGERIKVACVSSGFVCEYLKPDLSFADGYEVLTLLALLVHNFTSTNVQCAKFLKADLFFDDGCKVLRLLAVLKSVYLLYTYKSTNTGFVCE